MDEVGEMGAQVTAAQNTIHTQNISTGKTAFIKTASIKITLMNELDGMDGIDGTDGWMLLSGVDDAEWVGEVDAERSGCD